MENETPLKRAGRPCHYIENPPNRARELRQRAGLDVCVLAEKIGVQPQRLGRYEKEGYGLSWKYRYRIAQELGVPLPELDPNTDK